MPIINLPLAGEANWGVKLNTAVSTVNAAVDGIPNSVTAYSGTSVTSLVVSVGSKVFTTQAGKSWTVGQRVRAAFLTTPTTYVEGLITAYSTTLLTINVDAVAGSGTITSWVLNLTGEPGTVPITQALDLYWNEGTLSWEPVPAGTSATRQLHWWSLQDATAPQPPDALPRSTWFKKD